MTISFSQIEEKIDELNKMKLKPAHTQLGKYNSLFWQIFDALVEMENEGEIVIEPNKKCISYLRDILENDGPEYSYTIIFWHSEDTNKRYKIGVCVRGLPIVKKILFV